MPKMEPIDGEWRLEGGFAEFEDFIKKIVKMRTLGLHAAEEYPEVRMSAEGRFYLLYGHSSVFVNEVGRYWVVSEAGNSEGDMADGFPENLG